MPELIYPTATRIKGPILITSDLLMELDSILDDHLARLREARQIRIQAEVEERMKGKKDTPQERQFAESMAQTSAGLDRVNLSLTLSDGSYLKAKSFRDAATHAELSKNVAIDFDLSIECGDVSLAMSAESGYATRLSLSVTPATSENARTLFSAVSRWIRKIQPPIWQQWWCTVGHNSFFVWISFVTTLLLGALIVAANVDTNYYKVQGRELLKQGITQTNQQKAIETMLALQTDAAAPVPHKLFGNWFWFFTIGGAIVSIILSFPPRVVLGLGIGEDRIRFWKGWTRFVFVVVPTFVASNFLWPYASDAIKRIATH